MLPDPIYREEFDRDWLRERRELEERIQLRNNTRADLNALGRVHDPLLPQADGRPTAYQGRIDL